MQAGPACGLSSSVSVARISKYKRRLEQLLVQLYERFWKLPVAIVLASLWVMGATLIGLCVLMLRLLGVWLRIVIGM